MQNQATGKAIFIAVQTAREAHCVAISHLIDDAMLQQVRQEVQGRQLRTRLLEGRKAGGPKL